MFGRLFPQAIVYIVCLKLVQNTFVELKKNFLAFLID